MYNIIMWNAMGVVNVPTIRRITNMIDQYKIDFLAIMEPMPKKFNITTTTQKHSFNKFTSNGDVHGKI